MNASRLSPWVASVGFVLLALVPAQAATPDYWMCSNMIGGTWNFGNAPNACNVAFKQDPAAVRAEFQPILFLDAQGNDAERSRYMSQLYPVMREFAAYYIRRRNPSVSDAEVTAFQTALFSLLHQESVWSHYRDGADGLVRSMRGDVGHGHGIMQIDDNAHFADINVGKGVDFAQNVVMGLDEFYSNWVRSATQSCVGGATDYYNRTRAAWAAYNGGPGSICRFTNASSPWKQHDIDFKGKLDNQTWTRYVASKTAPSQLDPKCLAEGVRPCAIGGGAPAPAPQLSEGGLYAASGGRYCIVKSDALECVSSFGDVGCIEAREGKALTSLGTLSAADEASHAMTALERGALCAASIAQLLPIGTDAKLATAINFRSTAGGALLSTLAAGSVYRVLDFSIVNGGAGQDRYYKFNVNGVDGWIYGGDKTTYASWATKAPVTTPAPAPSTQGLAKVGDTIIAMVSGAENIRQTPGGNPIVGTIPGGGRAVVLEVSVTDANSNVNYKITYGGKTGWIYSGQLAPTNTLASWTTVAPAASRSAPAVRYATLPANVAYRYLRTCAGTSCSYSSAYVLGTMNPVCQNAACTAKGDRMQIVSTQAGWTQAQTIPGGQTGWLQSADVVEFAP